MKTISARIFLLTGALICLSGCGNILGTGGKSTLYRISSTPVPEREIARQWIPVYITRPTLPPGADGDRILTIENREVTYLAKARWMRPAPEMIREAIAGSVARKIDHAYIPVQSVASDHYVLSARLSSFAAYYDQGPDAAPIIRIAAQVELSRSKESEPLAVTRIVLDRSASANSVSSIVEAFDRASLEMADEIASWTAAAIN
jgi:cholesterol transport system auxiliary component